MFRVKGHGRVEKTFFDDLSLRKVKKTQKRRRLETRKYKDTEVELYSSYIPTHYRLSPIKFFLYVRDSNDKLHVLAVGLPETGTEK